MRFIRLLLAGVIAAAVLVAGFFAAAVLLLTGLVGYLVQRVRGQAGGTVRPGRPAATNRERPLATGDVIDVEVTKVSTDSSGR